MSTNFFLRTHPGYVPHNTPGGFCNASAPAVAVMPPDARELRILFTASGISEKNEILFSIHVSSGVSTDFYVSV